MPLPTSPMQSSWFLNLFQEPCFRLGNGKLTEGLSGTLKPKEAPPAAQDLQQSIPAAFLLGRIPSKFDANCPPCHQVAQDRPLRRHGLRQDSRGLVAFQTAIFFSGRCSKTSVARPLAGNFEAHPCPFLPTGWLFAACKFRLPP